MAASMSWRKCLNDHPFCKKLKENNAKDTFNKIKTDAKNLIVTNDDGDLFVWDSYAAHLVHFRLKYLLSETKVKARRFQIFQCTDTPHFEVEGIILSRSEAYIIVWGQGGIKVIELPQRFGQYGEFEGGKETVLCRTIAVGERYLSNQQKVKLLHVAWHPGSATDTHIVLLTSDNVLSIYDIIDAETPEKIISLDERDKFTFSSSPTKMKVSSALGDTAVCFDFGPVTELKPKRRFGVENFQEALPVWPIYVVRGNGDVMIVHTSFRFSTNPMPILGPLMMSPPADDNYGLDACSILCLNLVPPVVVIATSEGKLHHCILVDDTEESDNFSSISESGSEQLSNSTIYEAVSEPTLCVYESVELELSLTETDSERPSEDDFICPIRLVKDPRVKTRYHCCHGAGVHTISLPWVSAISRFLLDSGDECRLPQNKESIVEHVICTKPTTSSAPAPILGLDVITDHTLTPTLLTLTSEVEFIALPLSNKNLQDSEPHILLSNIPGSTVTSPLRRLNREPFDQHVAKILFRNSSQPILKSGLKSDLSQQECYQLLTRATQVFREEYIQKQDLARQEIETRIRILREQKKKQQDDIEELCQSRNKICDTAETISSKLENAKDLQETLLKRLESIIRKIQSRVPMLSDAEKHLLTDLKTMKGSFDIFANKIQQSKMKMDFQERQLSEERVVKGSPSVQKTQIPRIKDVLIQQGDEIAGLMKQINQLKLETTT